MLRVTFIALFTTLVSGGGCGSKEEKPKPPPAPVDGIEIVQPGAEPRQVLRYAVASGTTTPLEVATDLDAKLADRDAKLPTLVLDVDLAILTVDPDGTAHVKMTVVGAKAVSRSDADAPAMPVMERQGKQLTGMVVTYALGPAGQVKDSKVVETNRDLSQPMQEQTATLLQASERVAMALPDKPIGVGGIWKHRRTMQLNQLTVVSVTTVEVTAIEGPVVSFKSTTEMTGADQTLAAGSGAPVKVTRIAGSGTSAGTFDLGKAVVLGQIQAAMGFELVAAETRPTKLEFAWRIAPRAATP